MQVIMNQDLDVQVLLGGFSSAGDALLASKVVVIEGGESTGGEMGATTSGGTSAGMDVSMTATPKDPILASWPFVIGISSGTLFISIIIGILLAKRKIKKGFELYED